MKIRQAYINLKQVYIDLKSISTVGLLLLLSGCISTPPKQENQALEQNAHQSLIAVEILHLDIDHLVDLVSQIHPEPFALITQQSFISQANLLKQSIRYPLSRIEFYLKLAPLVASLGDIHSQLVFPHYLRNRLLRDKKYKLFPLAVIYQKEQLYVAVDLSAHPQIPTGAVISHINQVPVKYLLRMMQRLNSKETDSGQRRKIQVDFPWLLAMLGYAKTDYSITYYWKNSEHHLTIEGLDLPQVVENNEKNAKQKNDFVELQDKLANSYYGYTAINHSTALLWFNDFNETPSIFKSYIDKKFSQIKEQGITNLIIDVRYNDGGISQNIKYLLSYLSKKPLYWAKSAAINISQPLKKSHQQHTKARRKSKYRWGLQWLPLEWTDSLQYKILWGDLGEVVKVEFEATEPKNHDSFNHLMVLTNGYCYSACSSLVAIVNKYNIGTTIGETAGSFAKVQYAYPIKTQLPHSQLNLILPTTKLLMGKENNRYKMIKKQHDWLITPKIAVSRSPQQIINREDALIKKALELMKQ